jgi:hypothetical protein
MMRFRTPVAAGLLLIGCVSAHATWYTSESSFVAAINPLFYLEDFSTFTNGSPLSGTGSWNAPGANGYGFTATAPPNGLFSINGRISTNGPGDPLILTFSGNPVQAFGGIIANTNSSGNNTATGNATITLSSGDTQTVLSGSFLGWVGPTVLTSATITSAGLGSGWAALDHAYVGSVVAPATPEPITSCLMGLGALTFALRRRNRARA